MGALNVRSLMLLLATLILGGCMVSEVDPKPQVQFDPKTDFGAIKTFGWQQDPFADDADQPVAEATQQELLAEAARQLEKKGLQQVRSGGDVLVGLSVGTKFGAVVDNYQQWGEEAGVGYLATESDLRDITTAGLTIEMVDGNSGQPVWSGWATTPLTQEVYADRDEVVEAMVDAVLKKYPPGK